MITTRLAARSRPVAALAAVAVVAALAIGACTSAGSPNPSALASIIANASLPPLASASPPAPASQATGSGAPSESALPSAVATDIDPCQLITAADASALVGATFGAGKASTTENNLKICTYAAPGPNIFSVEVAVAPDVATAKAAEAATKADLESKTNNIPMTVTELPNFAPDTDAALLEGAMSGGGLSAAGKAMFLLKGTTFVGFSDFSVGGQPPSAQAMKDKATEVLGKLP